MIREDEDHNKIIKVHLTIGNIWIFQKGVRAVEEMASKAIIHFSRDGLALKAHVQKSAAIVLLRMEPSTFVAYECDEDEIIAEIDLGELWQCLLEPKVTYPFTRLSISSHNDQHHRQISLTFPFDSKHDDSLSVTREMKLKRLTMESDLIDDLLYDFNGILSISGSTHYQPNFITVITAFGPCAEVCITNKQLKLSAYGQETVLQKAKGEISIDGVQENESFEFKMGLLNKNGYVSAYELSQTVLIFTPAQSASHFMLKFPIDQLGDIKFFIPLIE